MKNTKKKVLTLVMGGLLLMATSCQQKNKQQEEDRNQKEQIPEVDEKVSKPDGIISLKEAKVLCDNYENRRTPLIKKFEMTQNSENSSFVPTQFVTFDFKTMEKYIKYVKRESRRVGVKPDSLRIYLGNYGADGREPNKNTVFVLPATTIGQEYGGYYIENKKAKLIRNYWPKGENENGDPKSKASLLPNFSAPVLFQSDMSFIMNHGQSGPPPPGDF